MQKPLLPVYVGYDQREHAAWLVCAHTIEHPPTHRTPPANSIAIPLPHRDLRRRGLFSRSWTIDDGGQYIDQRDGRPFSTEFAHSRFLVPRMAAEAGYTGWVLFVDCDFLFRAPPAELLEYADPSKACMVVKFAPVLDEGVKMDGMLQQRYRRKLWSSLVLWNLDHPGTKFLIDRPELASHLSGGYLHAFGWLADDQIGDLPATWNHVPGLSDPIDNPKAVHYSTGGPWLAAYEDVPFADEWRGRLERLLRADTFRLDDLYALA